MKPYGKPNKSNYFSRTRDFEKKDRWDHGGYDQLETEKKTFKKYEKNWPKRNTKDTCYTEEKCEMTKDPAQNDKTDRWKHVFSILEF